MDKKSIRKYFVCMIILGLFLVQGRDVNAKRSIPEKNLRYPVLLTLENGSTASGFYLNIEHRDLYFVTAKHVIFNQVAEEEYTLKTSKASLLSYPAQEEVFEPVELGLDLVKLMQNGHIKYHPDRDVAIIKLTGEKTLETSADLLEGVLKKPGFQGGLVSAGLEGIKTYDKVHPSNDVFIFGYPTSLGIASHEQIDYTRPLLRKGIIAGKNDKIKTIIIDCPVYYGNSGGPCVEYEEIDAYTAKFNLIGVVSEFVPFEEKWLNIKHGYAYSEIENSGYSIVVPIDYVLELVALQEAS